MRVEVVYAEAERSIECWYTLGAGACVADALALARADAAFAGVDLDGAAVGVFGRVVAREAALADLDRVEIYRLLAEDPKLARRRRARGK
jgi:hypothetical protein